MPVFNNPRQAIIVEGSGWLSTVLPALGALLIIGAVATFVIAHAVLIAACLIVFVAVMGGTAVAMRIAASGRGDVPVIDPHPVAPVAVQRAILAPPRAIAPAQHIHLHLHGVSTEDAAAIVRRQDSPGRPPNVGELEALEVGLDAMGIPRAPH